MSENRKAAGRTRTGSVKRAWLLMVTQGGRWSASEVQQELGHDLHAHLQRMVESGHAKKFPGGAKSNSVKFGVTTDCKVPIGVTLKELAKARLIEVELLGG